jgi:tetratricopeptide (TPR) repeat protein
VAEKLDRMDVLERDLRAILAADPKNGQALNALGYTLADRTDRYQEALGYIEQALACCPTMPPCSTAWAGCNTGWAITPRLWSICAGPIRINPDAEIAAHLSEVLWVSGQREEAKKIWRAASTKQPDSRHLRQLQERFGW